MTFDSVLSPELLKAVILLWPAFALGIILLIQRPTYFQLVGMMLGVLLNIPYLFLINILAETMGWWVYEPAINSYYNIPIEIVLGWSIFWGALLPYLFKSINILYPVMLVLIIDVWTMPLMTNVFTLGEYWLLGELVMVSLCLLPSIIIFRFTDKRSNVVVRALIQSYIWGGWMIFLIPSIALFVDNKNIFDFFRMDKLSSGLFLIGMGISIVIGYLALFEFARVGKGTPIPFDPPQKLIITGIYAYVANPLQISTLFMFICLMIFYQSWMLLLPIVSLIIYSEGLVRWHHSVDIEKRFGKEWLWYRKSVKNWIPNRQAYSSI